MKIYGLEEKLSSIKQSLSEVIHSCNMEVFKLPKEKKFHRFFPLKRDNFFFPSNRSENYMIIEIIMFEGRAVKTKKELIKMLFYKIEKELKISSNDIEIVLIEIPQHNWGIRGIPGDELKLNYKTDI